MIETIFERLKSAGMVDSANEFSIEWLGMEESYMRCMRAKCRDPSPRALINCAVKLKRTGDALKTSNFEDVRDQGDSLRGLARHCVEHVFGEELQELLPR